MSIKFPYNVSVIEIKKTDLPDKCYECRFFDRPCALDEDRKLRDDRWLRRYIPEYDPVENTWKKWAGDCRRHPPTSANRLPEVQGWDMGCGDGIVGRHVWEFEARAQLDAVIEAEREAEREAEESQSSEAADDA